MVGQFRGQIENLINRRKADTFRKQIEELRDSIDDTIKAYNKVMTTGSELIGEAPSRFARQARETLGGANMPEEEGGFSWWVPVAIVGAVGAAIWLYNQLTGGGTQPMGQPTTNFPAGSQPHFPPGGTTFSEQR
jgi:hypothetical protein